MKNEHISLIAKIHNRDYLKNIYQNFGFDSQKSMMNHLRENADVFSELNSCFYDYTSLTYVINSSIRVFYLDDYDSIKLWSFTIVDSDEDVSNSDFIKKTITDKSRKVHQAMYCEDKKKREESIKLEREKYKEISEIVEKCVTSALLEEKKEREKEQEEREQNDAQVDVDSDSNIQKNDSKFLKIIMYSALFYVVSGLSVYFGSYEIVNRVINYF